MVFFVLTHAYAKDLKETAQKTKTDFKILILGDSITAGYGVSKKEAYPAVLESLLNSKSNKLSAKFRVLAAGTSGSTSASALKRLKWHFRKKPNLLLLALGGNDGLRGVKPKATKENLEKAIRFAHSKDVKVLLVGMKIPMNYGAAYRASFEKTFTDLVKKHKLSFLPFLLEGVGGVANLNLPDGIHPNEKGHAKIAQTVHQKILEIL